MKRKDIWGFIDVETPCVRNNNAQETLVFMAEQCGLGKEVGIKFFQRIESVDNIWGGDRKKIRQDPYYRPGGTLKVILPFLRAMDVTSKDLYDFARRSIKLTPNIKGVLASLDSNFNVRLLSTAYCFFVRAFCDSVDFQPEKAYCTRVDEFDEVPITEHQSEMLKYFMKEIASWPVIRHSEIRGGTISEYQRYYNALTGFIWEFVFNLPVGIFLQNIHPIDQQLKREVMVRLINEKNIQREKTFFVGDSEVDLDCIHLLKENGLTLAFNGTGKVCEKVDLVYAGDDATIIEEVANLFARHGRERTIEHFTPIRQVSHGVIGAVTPQNIGELKEISIRKREEFLGTELGKLT